VRLLLIEDDRALVEVVRKALIELGHVVDSEFDGRRGLETAELGDYDGLIVDVMLPGLDGFSIVRTLRDRGKTTPILVLTARDEASDVVAGLDAGADDYLRKPFVFAELLARLRAITRRESSERIVERLCAGDIVMDLVTRSVTRGGRCIRLTAREIAFLEFFLRRPRAVVTRAQLEDALWESDRDTVSNLIEVYVRRLRQKLCLAGEPDPIETVRGIGYRLAAANDA
jgi:two-component system copper resistance phosphate regulon response regulator CusR